MNPKIPGTLVGIGFLFEQITVFVKKVAFLQFLARAEHFQWTLAALGAVAISSGIFLSLYGLCRCPKNRKLTFAMIHFLGLVVFCWVIGVLISEYVLFSKINSMEVVPSVLPKLVENSQALDSAAKREKMAQNAYKIYGVTLAYPADDGQWIKYAPTAEDVTFHEKYVHDSAVSQELKDSIIGGQLRQIPFLLAMNWGIFMATFFVGALWLIFRKSDESLEIQS